MQARSGPLHRLGPWRVVVRRRVGRDLPRAATPFGGGPGGVLFYAVLAVLLWPSEGSNTPFVAARTVGLKAARAIWVAVWGLLALLSVVGSGRSPQGAARSGGRSEQRAAGVARAHRPCVGVLLSPSRHPGGDPARRCLSDRRCRRVSSPPDRPGDPGACHRCLRRHLGRRPELRWDPRRWRHRPQLWPSGHRACPDLLAPERRRNVGRSIPHRTRTSQ